MKKSKHPNWALKQKKPGTELRYINGHYYLYEVTSKWDKEKKRPKKISGKILGSITKEHGFKPSRRYNIGQTHFEKPLQTREYGACNFILNRFQDYIKQTEEIFPDIWKEIISMAFIRLMYNSSIKDTAFRFEYSYISQIYQDITLGEKRVSALYRKIGTDREKVVNFMQSFFPKDDCILFDGTQFISHSKQIKQAKVGYSSKQNYQPQLNILFLFSTTIKLPLFYRILPGNITDVKAFKLTLEETGIKNSIVIADKGFYSESNIETLENINARYIIPLRRNNTIIDYSPLSDPANNKFDGYFKFQSRFLWYKESIKDGKRVVVFLDKGLKAEEEKDYLNRIETHPEKYSFEKFQQKNSAMGTLAMIANLHDKTPENIYETYKTRAEIETMIDAMKNILELDTSYMQNETALQGWMFISFIALQWYYDIYKYIKDKKLVGKYSPKLLLEHLAEINKIKINKRWEISEMTNKTKSILNKLDIHIT